MKDPRIFNKNIVYLFAFGGLVTLAIMVFSFPSNYFPLSVGQILGMFGVEALYIFMGFCLMRVSVSIFNREVNEPVDPAKLILGEIYWLNGETHAIYLGTNEYTGKLNFYIYGVCNPDNMADWYPVYPGDVRRYFSEKPEA